MYTKLLLSNQGGIIDEIHRSDQDNCAVVAIGLGGTGCDCLRNLKAKIFNRVNPDDIEKIEKNVQEYKHIKFWAVDTDKEAFRQANDKHSSIDKLNMDTEFFDLSYSGNINAVFERNGPMLSKKGEYKEWLRFDDIRVSATKAGACGVRQIGRYLLMEKANDFIAKIRKSISDAKSGLLSPKVYVHIFSGLGGGTGAGTFLDVCYLVQKALEAEGTNAFVCGYFFLPDVNLARGLDDETEKYIRINGYASLQELDYCMNFERNGEKWSQRYPGIGLIESKKPPVDICHLISGHDASGNVIPKAYDYAMNVVTDYFMDFLIKSSSDFTMESHIANYNNRKAMLNKDSGANYEYCILGASNAALPYKEVLTYLSTYLFSAMTTMKSNSVLNGDCDIFIKKNGLGFQSLYNIAILGANLTFPDPDNRPRDAYEDDDLVTKYFADLRAEAIGVVSRNLNQMSKKIESFDTDNANGAAGKGEGNVYASSIITKIFYALNSIVEDPEKGPYYASSLINGTSGNDLVSYVNGYIETVDSKISQLEYNLPKYETARTQAQNNFKNCGHVSNRRYREYLLTSQSLIKQYAEQKILYEFKDFLITLRKQLVEISNNYYKIYCLVISELCDTFLANKNYLESIADAQHDYEYPIARITDEKLRNALDTYLHEKFDIPTEMKKFHQYMLSSEGYKAWKDKKENSISKYISNYFSGIFKEYTSKSMTQYLMEKYGTDDTDTIIQNVRDDIMGTLEHKANPLYWTSALYNIGGASKIGYTTVPDECNEVVAAAEKLNLANEELKVRKSNAKDRITIMRCLVGAPLYGYQPLTQYETSSTADTEVIGKHLYEGRTYVDDNGQEVTGRDWRRLPSPTPLSKMNSDNAKELFDLAKHRKELYERAEQLGIIDRNIADEYMIKIIDESFIDRIRQMYKASIDKDNATKFDTMNKVKQMKSTIEYSNIKIKIPNDAKNGDSSVPESEKKIVRIDHFASMPLICEKVEAEISKIEEIDEIIVSLEPKIDSDFEDFANALFTGAVKINGIMLIYENDFYEEVKLSAPNMPMGGMRLYQAFVSFKELDDSTKEKLKSISEKRNAMEDGMDCIINACTNVKVQLDQKNIAMALRIASTKFPANANEIKDFYNNLSSKFDEYTMTYGLAI